MEMVTVNVGGEAQKLNKEDVLRDFVRFSWKVTRGLTTSAEKEATDLVGKVVATGRVSEAEGAKLLSSLIRRMEQSRAVFEARVDASVRRAVEKLNVISTNEVTRLADQVGELEKRLEKLTTKPGK